MAKADVVRQLETARDNIGSIIEAQTAAWVTAGCPPTFSVDGESYQWDSWLSSRLEEIDKLTEKIQKLSSPHIVRHRGRA